MSCTDVQTIQAGNGTKTQFSFDFPYIFKSEIHVYFWNATTKEWDEKLTTDATHPWRITDANPTIVEFTSTAPPSPATPVDPGEPTVDNVKIRRITNLDDIRALFNPGSAIRSDDLNNNFEQLRYAIQEANCPGVPEEIQEYLEEYYWDRFDNTLYSADTWRSDDATIATTAALDARFQDEANETITSSESWVSDNDHVATTAAIDARFQDELSETITSSETWPDNDDTIATTAAIDNRIDTAITNDIGTDGTGITVTDDGDGTITLGLGSGSIDLDRIKAEDIITQAEQNADFDLAGDDDSVFTSSAAIRRFENYVQNNAPSGTGIGTGRMWLDVEDDLTLSVWNGSAWTAISSGGTFSEQPNVVYVDASSGSNDNDGHRISRPKLTIKAAIEQINSEIEIDVTATGFNGGSGYVDGTYSNVSLTHSSGTGIGTGLTATVTVSGGAVTAITLSTAQQTTLEEYSIGDVLTASNADLGGSGSGLLIPITGNGDGQIVVVAAGTYQEVAPLQIKRRNVSVIGQALRSCIVHPTSATELNNLFELNSGSYIANLTLTGMQAGTGTGNTLDAVLPTDQGWNFAFYNNAFITKSPYIQNCTNFSDSEIDNDDLRSHRPRGGTAGDTDSDPTGGGLLVNGATPHADSPLRSMVCDSYTHVGLNGPGILVTNNGYAQCTSSYAFFNRYHIKALNGGQANLAASTTDFGAQALVADGRSTTNIFTANCVTQANVNDTTIRVSNGVADASWHGTSTRPATNMLLSVNSDAQIYPITNVVPQDQATFDADPAGYTGDWIVTISRPNPDNRSDNQGFSAQVNTGTNNVQFWLRSMIASSGHTMEYVGSGTNYTALPENGGVPDETQQIVESNNGKVWTAITDHNGKFKIGGNQTDDPIFEVDQQLGFVTIPEGSIAFNLLSDQTPQLGGNLDVNGNEITSASNGNVVINPNGTGVISLDADVGIGTTNPGSADLAIVHPRNATNFARVSIGQNVDGQGSTGGNHLGLWYGNADSDRADIFTSAGNMNFWVDGAADGTGQFTFGRTFNTEWMRIDDSGRLLVGTSTSSGQNAGLQIASATGQYDSRNAELFRFDATNDTGGPTLYLTRSKSDTIGTIAAVNVDDGLGEVRFAGAGDASTYLNGASIRAFVDAGTVSATSLPTRLLFATAADGESSPTERMRISANGDVGIGTTSPGHSLAVRSGTANSDIANFTGATVGRGLVIGTSNDGGAGDDTVIYNATQSTGGHVFEVNASEKVRIDSSGRVGIGTSTVDRLLHVEHATDNTVAKFESGDANVNIEFADNSTTTPPTVGANGNNLRLGTGGTSVIEIDSSQRVGIGTTSPQQKQHIHENSTAASVTQYTNSVTGSGVGDGFLVGLDSTEDGLLWVKEAQNLTFGTSNTERARIDSSGRLLVGTSTTTAICTAVFEGNSANSASSSLIYLQRGAEPTGTQDLGLIVFADNSQNNAAFITGERDNGTWTSGSSHPGALVFATTANGVASPTTRMRITSTGSQIMGQTGTNFTLGSAGYGVDFQNGVFNGVGICKNSTAWGTALWVHRTFNVGDGTLIEFAHDTVSEGSISVSGTTVSYNGGHLSRWSQTLGAVDTALLLKGTVMTNLDEMCEWTLDARAEVLWTEDDELPEGVSVGDIKTPAREAGVEDNEQLNKMAISSVEGDPNVAGVLVSIDEDGDLNVGMTGDMIIRIAQGVTVERGDLLMSAGDGTAKPQDDDIIRSKTIAKVTSTNVSCTYDDGSYCVPCVLMAC